jgi:hypothetical protein
MPKAEDDLPLPLPVSTSNRPLLLVRPCDGGIDQCLLFRHARRVAFGLIAHDITAQAGN